MSTRADRARRRAAAIAASESCGPAKAPSPARNDCCNSDDDSASRPDYYYDDEIWFDEPYIVSSDMRRKRIEERRNARMKAAAESRDVADENNPNCRPEKRRQRTTRRKRSTSGSENMDGSASERSSPRLAMSPPKISKKQKRGPDVDPSRKGTSASAATVTPHVDKSAGKKGVLNRFRMDLYRNVPCSCPPTSASINGLQIALSNAYLRSYGDDYFNMLLEKERSMYPMIQLSTEPGPELHWDDYKLPLHPSLTTKMRATLVNWLVDVAHEYNVSDAAFHLAVSLLDQFFFVNCNQTEKHKKIRVVRNCFQVLGCACLWIAAKLEDKTAPFQDDLVYISDHSFNNELLLAFEAKICRVLKFRFQLVTPLHFCEVFLRASQACGGCCRYPHTHGTTLGHLTRLYVDISRLSYRLVRELPSRVAAACIYLARAQLGLVGDVYTSDYEDTDTDEKSLGQPSYWTSQLETVSGHDLGWLAPTVATTYRVVELALFGEDQYHAARNKVERILRRKLPPLPPMEDLRLPQDMSYSGNMDVNSNKAVVTPQPSHIGGISSGSISTTENQIADRLLR